MRQAHKPPKQGKRGEVAPLAATLWGLALAVLLTQAGCSGLHKRDPANNEDPLVGPGPRGLKADPNSTTRTKSPVPPVPAANTSASNAAMAAGQLTGGRPLAIEDTRPQAPTGWQGIGPDGRPLAADGVQTTSGAILRRPQPIVEPLPHEQPQPAAAQPVPAISVGSQGGAGVDQLQAELKARGVTWQRQEVTRTGIRVTCMVPNPARPDNPRFYEAQAADPVAALQALVARIDRGP